MLLVYNKKKLEINALKTIHKLANKVNKDVESVLTVVKLKKKTIPCVFESCSHKPSESFLMTSLTGEGVICKDTNSYILGLTMPYSRPCERRMILKLFDFLPFVTLYEISTCLF